MYSPTGELQWETSNVMPFLCEPIDLAHVADVQRNYPCYVREIDTDSMST
jgi:hypothetical protein